MDSHCFYRLKLTPLSKAILDDKKNSGSTYVDAINNLIDVFGSLPDDISSDLTFFAKSKALYLSKDMESSGLFMAATKKKSLDKYLAIIAYLNAGIPISIEEIRDELDMRKIEIKNGCLIYPKDFVLVNSQDAKDMEAAYVIECQNAKRYDIPYYIVFWHPHKPYETTEAYNAKLLAQLLQKIPEFQRIVDLQVSPIYDPEHPEIILNEKELDEAPTIKYFPVYVHGDPRKPADYKPPRGVEIVHLST